LGNIGLNNNFIKPSLLVSSSQFERDGKGELENTSFLGNIQSNTILI